MQEKTVYTLEKHKGKFCIVIREYKDKELISTSYTREPQDIIDNLENKQSSTHLLCL